MTRPTTSTWSTCGPSASTTSPTTSPRSRSTVRADADLLVVGWGSTWGAIDGAVHRVRAKGHNVAMTHLTHLNPFPKNLGDVVKAYPRVLVPEMNLGQLSLLLRGHFLVDAQSVTKMKGLPFTAGEIEQAILAELEN